MTKQTEVVKDYMGRGIIRRLNNSKSYFMRFRFNEHKSWTPWRTTGTSEFEKAQRVAAEHYDGLKAQLKDAEDKQDVSKFYSASSFMSIVRVWLKDYEMRASEPSSNQSLQQYEVYKGIADRYLQEFFGGRRINTITTETVYEYVEWRRNYWLTGPGSKIDFVEVERAGRKYRKPVNHKSMSLQSGELGFIKAVFKLALIRGKLTQRQMPEFPTSSKSIKDIRATRHPAFSTEHWKTLADALPRYLEVNDPNVQKARQLFAFYFVIMAETGLRPGKEASSIKWQHVTFNVDEETEQEYAEIYVPIETKTGARTIVAGPAGCLQLKQLKTWTDFDKPTDPIFASQSTGKAVYRFDGSLKALLKFAEINTSHDEKRYTCYSLRHTYATRKRAQGYDDLLLLRMMGHSDNEMIFKHYAQENTSAHIGTVIAADTPKPKRSDHDTLVKSVLKLTDNEPDDVPLNITADGNIRHPG